MRLTGDPCRRGLRAPCLPWLLLLGVLLSGWVRADPMLPADLIQRLVQPWPPEGWSAILDLPGQGGSGPHRSEPRTEHGYFGQSLYRHIPGTKQYWTANILIRDRGSTSAAWRAVSTVRCKIRIFRGYRARECERGSPGTLTRTLHYEVGRFYITIQVSGPGVTDYPRFDLAGVRDGPEEPGFFSPFR
jgi:hypothetical protein